MFFTRYPGNLEAKQLVLEIFIPGCVRTMQIFHDGERTGEYFNETDTVPWLQNHQE